MRSHCRGAAHERPARELCRVSALWGLSSQQSQLPRTRTRRRICPLHLSTVLTPGGRRNEMAVLRCSPSHGARDMGHGMDMDMDMGHGPWHAMARVGRSLPLCGVMLRR
jgi:hypothetical protein